MIPGESAEIRRSMIYFAMFLLLTFQAFGETSCELASGPLSSDHSEQINQLRTGLLPECNVRAMIDAHKGALPESQSVVSFPGEGAVLNPLSRAPLPNQGQGLTFAGEKKRRALLNMPEVRTTEQLMALAEKLKKNMLDQISGSDGISADQRRIMTERLSRLKFRMSENTECGASASNSNISIGIDLCSTALKVPELELVVLISHELGHTLDLCDLSSRVFETRSNGNIFTEQSARSDENEMRALNAKIFRGEVTTLGETIPVPANPAAIVQQCLNESLPRTYPAFTDSDAVCQTEFTEMSAQIYAARAVARYVDGRHFSSSEVIGFLGGSFPSYKSAPTGKEFDMNSLFFQEPQIQRAMGCRMIQSNPCMGRFPIK